MKQFFYIVFVAFFFLSVAKAESTHVVISTNKGELTLALNSEKAPKTVANFLRYVDEGFYNETIFHRVIKDFMIQGGGLTVDLSKKTTHKPIQNEANNGLKNVYGSIAMARTSDPHSATAQFFINVKDNAFLDYTSETPRGWGYAVFGKVVKGMKIVDQIAAARTDYQAGRADVPVETVLIQSIQRAVKSQ